MPKVKFILNVGCDLPEAPENPMAKNTVKRGRFSEDDDVDTSVKGTVVSRQSARSTGSEAKPWPSWFGKQTIVRTPPASSGSRLTASISEIGEVKKKKPARK